ncbi:RidA family protein [Leifsonia flava]|uniref:RidA family protein n=2 Tax=Orlajensenia leifsoniae TaxID=2561933 RepID=A0A4Y9QSP0_9MICO|nr:RidA family protein [Leifsonia flava]
MGPFLFSGVLTGRDPETHRMAKTLDEQCANVFTHVRALLAAAGGSTDDIAKMTFWLAHYRDRDALNREWVAMFPDAASRPARQAMAAQLDGGSLVQCDLVAVLD